MVCYLVNDPRHVLAQHSPTCFAAIAKVGGIGGKVLGPPDLAKWIGTLISIWHLFIRFEINYYNLI